MLWRAHLHFSVMPVRARRHHRVTIEQVSNRCLFNVLPLGLCFFGASWGLVRVLHLSCFLLPPRRSAACSEICMIFKAITVSLQSIFLLSTPVSFHHLLPILSPLRFWQLGSVLIVVLLFYLDHPYPFKRIQVSS
jgi:hypothetical protein